MRSASSYPEASFFSKFCEDFSLLDWLQGIKKVEDIFAQEGKVVDELLDVAKVLERTIGLGVFLFQSVP